MSSCCREKGLPPPPMARLKGDLPFPPAFFRNFFLGICCIANCICTICCIDYLWQTLISQPQRGLIEEVLCAAGKSALALQGSDIPRFGGNYQNPLFPVLRGCTRILSGIILHDLLSAGMPQFHQILGIFISGFYHCQCLYLLLFPTHLKSVFHGVFFLLFSQSFF